MSYPARPLRITVISPDTGVLHDLSWMLTAVGYKVVTSKDLGERAAWRRFCETDFIIFDGRSISNPTSATLAHHSDNPIYRFFLYSPSSTANLTAWFAAGANDALRVPASRGELLSRTRVGARMLEFERRLRSQSTKSHLPGLNSVRGLVHRLKQLESDGRSNSFEHTLLTVTIDFFAGLCRKEGELAAHGLLASLATSIQRNVSDNAISAYVDDGTFHILLLGQTAAAARGIAEHIGQSFREIQSERVSANRISLTTAIVPWQRGVSPEQLLEQGQETLALALQSGGDCTIEQNTFANELSTWQNELTVGSPFANVVAQDIMEPFPCVLERHQVNPAMLTALHRSGAPIWPFVNREGRLVGVFTPSATDATPKWDQHTEEHLALSNPVTIAYNATFSEIYDAFSTQGCLEMVVVADHHPIGYLTFSGFISLIEPINSATFANGEPAFEDSRCLLVGSLISEPERVSDSDQ
jgi:GGDEF domain-containing protein